MRSWAFAKGHGTHNDFVLIQDRHDMLDPSAEDVQFLCDRRGGIGGDGILRAIKAVHIPEWDGDPDLWFMDYRNADGSISEMCGNGVRVFVRYLLDEGLVSGNEVPIGTRAGLRTATVLPDGQVRVAMGPARVATGPTSLRIGDQSWPATAVNVGNPHAVAVVEDVAALDLTGQPEFDATVFPEGVNCEFIAISGHNLTMRVHERGVGETMSCGTGTVAAAAAAAQLAGESVGRWRVDVPGGTVEVELTDGQSCLTGPAEIVAQGHVTLPDRGERD